jgi:hypothetical protein
VGEANAVTYAESLVFRDYKQSLVCAILVCASTLSLAGCETKPAIIKEPYPVDVVREVVIPIPEEYTRDLPMPALPEGPITVLHLVTAIKEWQAWGEVVLEHRARVKVLSAGQE